jgi:hypothetical protein
LLDRAWNMRTSAAAVLALAAATLVRAPAAYATTAADICGDPGTDPCVLDRVVTVSHGSTLDFGARAFVIAAPNGRLQVGQNDSLSIAAGSMTVETGPGGRLRGDGGCLIDVAVTGTFALRKATLGSVAVDLSSKTDEPCELDVKAGGDVTIAAEIQAKGTLDSAAGSVFLTSDGSLTLSDRIVVQGPLTGGSADLAAQDAIAVTADGSVDASDADSSGSIVLEAGGSITMSGELDVNANGGRPEFGCDAGLVLLTAGGDITIAGKISGTGALSPLAGCGGGSLEMSAGRDILVNGPLDFSGGPNGFGGLIDEIAAGRDFVQSAPILVRSPGATGVAGFITIGAVRRLHVGALLDLSGGASVDPDFGFPGGGGNLVLRGGESLEIDAEVDGDGADYGSLTFTTATDSANDVPGRISVTGDVHAVSTQLEDVSADVLLEACEIEVAATGSLTKTGPASRNLLRASGSMRIAGRLEAGSGTNELQHRDPAHPPLILPGATLSPPPVVVAAPAEALRPCACTLESGAPGLLCNDGNPCTQEACDADLGCTSTPLAGDGIAGCDDGNVCTGRETCEALACVKGPAPAANDGDPCTDDGVCDPVSGFPRTPKTGLAAAACRMDRIELALAAADIPEDVTLKAFDRIGDLARSIRSLVRRADQASGKRRTKLLRSARKKVARLDRVVAAPKSHVSPALARLFGAATSETRAVLLGP